MSQTMFNPVNYEFNWTDDGSEHGWYEWDRAKAHKAALKARNMALKAMRLRDVRATAFSIPDQLITRGGIGSGHPQVEFVVNVYGIQIF